MVKAKRSSTSRLQSYGFMMVTTLVWAVSFIIVKPSYEITTPFRFLFYRFLLASVLAIPILLYYWRKIKVTPALLAKIVGIEILGTCVALAFVYWGLNFTSAIEANLLTSAMPLFVILGGILLLNEKQERHEWMGLGVAAIGTLVLTLVPILAGEQNGLLRLSLFGNLLILIHHIANFFYFPLAKKYYAGVPKLFASSVSFYVGLVTFALLSLWEAGSVPNLALLAQTDLQFPSVLIASGYMAIFGSIIGLTAYFKGQDGIEASEAALFSYLQPAIYLPLGVLILGEILTPWHILGLLLTTIGVYLAERRVIRR